MQKYLDMLSNELPPVKPLTPNYMPETVGAWLNVDEVKTETSKRNGNIIRKYKTKITFLTKNWHSFSYNFTIKIDTVSKKHSIISTRLYNNQVEEDFKVTKPVPCISMAWRIQYKSYNYWHSSAENRRYLQDTVIYDMGRGIKEQLPSIVHSMLKNKHDATDFPNSKEQFVKDIFPFVEKILDTTETTVPFDPEEGIELYRLEYKESDAQTVPDDDSIIDEPKPISYPRGVNGKYYARRIMEHVDVELLRTFRNTGMFCRLEGAPGCGKTALVEASYGEDLLTANGNSDYSPASFIGEWTINIERNEENPSEFSWNDGILCRAMKEGRPLFIDEATLLPSLALDAVYSATDGRGYIDLHDFPGKPRIHAKEGFYVIMAYNPNTLHGNELPEAIRSRFNVVLDIRTDYTSLKHFEIPSNAIRVANRLNVVNNNRVDSTGHGIWVPQMRELLGFKTLIDNGLSEEFAFNNWVGLCPELYREDLVRTIREVSSLNAQSLSLGGLAYEDDKVVSLVE